MTRGRMPKDFWDSISARYDRIMENDSQMKLLHKGILDRLPLSAQTVLDLGAGTGVLLEKIARRKGIQRLVWFDPSKKMRIKARQRLNGEKKVEYMIGNASRLKFKSGTFDAVVSNFALHHLTHGEKAACAREIWRVLKENGVFIFGDQHCRRMGTPDDPVWVGEIFSLLCKKADFYLTYGSLERMLLQVSLMPEFLLAKGEILATVEYWSGCLKSAGFEGIEIAAVKPVPLYNRIIVAHKRSAP